MRLSARLILATLLSLAVTAGTAVVLSPAQATTWRPQVTRAFDPAKNLNQFEARILVQVNRARVRNGLARVHVFHSCVDGYSERWAQRLKRADGLEHRDLGTVIDGCNLNWVGETLVSGTALTPANAVRAWLDSPSHRAVILKDRARWAGVGVRINDDGRVFAVLNFGDRS